MKKYSLVACLLLAACGNNDRPADTAAPATATPPAAPAAEAPEARPAQPQGALQQSPFDKMDRSPLRLAAGQSLTASLPASRQGELVATGVHIGNYRNTSDGTLSVEACNGADCRRAEAPLAGTKDNRFVMVRFPQALAVQQGDQLTFTFARKDGSKSFAIWTYAPVAGSASVVGIDGTPMARTIRVGLKYVD